MHTHSGRSWDPILTAQGWKKTHACDCGGVYREEYQKAGLKGYEIWIYPNGDDIRMKRAVVLYFGILRHAVPLNELQIMLTTYAKFNQ